MWSRRAFLIASVAKTLDAQVQFAAEAALVLAPVVVTDRRGNFVRGIPAEDFLTYDNGSRRTVSAEEDPQPLALVLALHASFDARKPLDRLRKAVGLFEPLVVGANGVAGLVAFRDEVGETTSLTSNVDTISTAVTNLEAKGSGCCLVDAVQASAGILREALDRRKVIVVVSEDRDRSSKADLTEVLIDLQKQNISVYPLTYSPALMQLGREVPTAP